MSNILIKLCQDLMEVVLQALAEALAGEWVLVGAVWLMAREGLDKDLDAEGFLPKKRNRKC